ncbi:MAG TPA: hypothetical protein P5076_08655 [Myxococcota bacterium]|nr:hypothetical protein [Myxococcota bacterium]
MLNHDRKHPLQLAATLLVVGCAWLTPDSASAATFVVVSSGDGGDASPGDGACATAAGVCTLRAAIQEHNALGGANAIHFNLSPLAAIRPSTNLPAPDSDLVIDGTTQPGFTGIPLVVLDGVDVGGGIGLRPDGRSEIRGLVLVLWERGIVLDRGPDVVVAGNFIGLSLSGISAQRNGYGNLIASPHHVIGGPDPADRNWISGNDIAGIEIYDTGDYTLIEGNYLGTDAGGNLDVPNTIGIESFGAQDVVIRDNLISGNTYFGLRLMGIGGAVTGNLIGTDASGTLPIPNEIGAEISGNGTQVGPVVGGPEPGAGNTISGNSFGALDVSAEVLVQGNRIGTARDDLRPISNGEFGISAQGPATIGGAAPGAGNVIAYNGGLGINPGPGIQARDVVFMQRNSIFSNAGLGIHRTWDPVYGAFLSEARSTRVRGSAVFLPFRSVTVDLYANTSLDPSGFGEGETWIGSAAVFTDAAGSATFEISLAFPMAPGLFVSATITDTDEGTSGFSPGLEVSGCLPGSGPCCDADGDLLPAGTGCRPAAGACDLTEVCDGASAACPPDAFLPSGATCRAAAGDCDAAESCAGDSAACPADLFLPDTALCRSTAGACDLAESCTGLAAACPEDAVHPVTVVCRAAVGACDLAETCTGASAACPPDAVFGEDTICRPASCVDGVETLATACAGTAGTCPPRSERPCAAYACGPTGCLTGCQTGADCAPGYTCEAGACLAPGGLGDPCFSAAECLSSSCVDGFCCDGSCAGQCEACDRAGAEGACGPVEGEPHGERTPCTADGSACGGACDGTNPEACAYPGVETPCREASCIDAVAVLPAACQGDGACPAEQAQACAPADCDGAICGKGCALDADCGAGQYCAAGVCADKLTQGEPCSGDHQCLSGPCVDGFCCDGACAGQCEACDLAGSEGACGPVEGAPHGGRAACAGQGACQGSCDGSDRDACALPVAGTACSPARCENYLATLAGTCDGAGTCSAATQVSCVPYVCGADGCLTTCLSSMDCVGGHECADGQCRPFELEASSGCGTSGGSDLGGLVSVLLLAGLWFARRRPR